MHRFKAGIFLYLSSMERKNFMKLKMAQLFYLVIKLMKPFAVPNEKLREVSVSYFFVRRITLMLSRISSEPPLLSISNKHNFKIFFKSPPASMLHCIRNILSHSSGKWRNSLTMAALSFTNHAPSFTFVQYLFTNISLVIA